MRADDGARDFVHILHNHVPLLPKRHEGGGGDIDEFSTKRREPSGDVCQLRAVQGLAVGCVGHVVQPEVEEDQVPLDDGLALRAQPRVEARDAGGGVARATVRDVPRPVLHLSDVLQQLLHVHGRAVLPCRVADRHAVPDHQDVWQLRGRLVTRPALAADARPGAQAVPTARGGVDQRGDVDAAAPAADRPAGLAAGGCGWAGGVCRGVAPRRRRRPWEEQEERHQHRGATPRQTAGRPGLAVDRALRERRPRRAALPAYPPLALATSRAPGRERAGRPSIDRHPIR